MTLKAFRLVFPPCLIGSPFVVYDGANRALKVSRASVAQLHQPGLLRQLALTTLMRRRVKKLNDAVIGRTVRRDSGCGKGFTEGREPTIASAIGDRQRDPQGKTSYPHLVNPLHAVAHLASFASPETLGATHKAAIVARRTRGSRSLVYRDLQPKRSVSETRPPKI
jgi:hypothetical protein